MVEGGAEHVFYVAVALRSQLASVLQRTGVLALAARGQRFSPYLPITGYHRIGDPAVVARETDEGVVDVTAADFERHVAFMATRFEVVGVDALRRYFVDKVPLPRNAALITFDDGYRECFDIALPILRRHGVPGIFFVSTDHVVRRKVFWWDRIAYLFKRCTKRERVEIEYPKPVVLDLAKDLPRAHEDALAVVKTTYGLDIERYLEGLSSALDVPWTASHERRISDETIMSWDHLRELRRAGMDVQSHSATHRILQTLSDEELKRELVDSKRVLEAELDEPICSIAYPNGHAVGQHTRIGRAVREAGYDLGFSGGGVCRLDAKTDPLDLRRVSVDLHVPEATFRARVLLPPVFVRG